MRKVINLESYKHILLKREGDLKASKGLIDEDADYEDALFDCENYWDSRLDHGNLKGITPQVAVVMIGTNNIGHGTHTTSEVLDGVRAVVQRIQNLSPQTAVLLLDIFPRGAKFNIDRGRILQINQALARLHDGKRVVFLPIGHVFLEDDGSISPEIMPDALHLTTQGYQRWRDAIEPTLQSMLSDEKRKE